MDKATVDTLLSNLKGGTFVGLDSLVDVKLKGGQKNPMQGRVQKVTTGSRVMVFTRGGDDGAYDRMVRRRLEQEGKDPDTFQLSARGWGTRIEGTPYVEHKGEYYLEVIFLQGGESSYLLDGAPIDKNDIEGLDEPKVNEESQAGLDNKVIVRTYKLSSITRMRAMGQEA